MTPLSVLDLAPVSSGRTSAQAIHESVALARHSERLGYGRFWVAEHHGRPGIASSAPAVLIAALAAATSHLRVGSGGVLLPNHAPLVVAEQFGTLVALHPGRIDLGLGRAPGTDPETAALLRRGEQDDFPTELAQLRAFFAGPVDGTTAVPALGNAPEVWLLGSGETSGRLAGSLGLPFAFAHHFSSHHTLPALDAYRSCFRPGVLDEPCVMVCASVLISDSYERARRLATPGALGYALTRQGAAGVLPTVAEAEAHSWTEADRSIADARLDSQVLGTPAEASQQLAQLLLATQADELMVTTSAHAFHDRLRSYELLADLATRTDGTLALA